MKIREISKKAQIGGGIAWFVATFIILLILIIYVVFAFIEFPKKGKPQIVLESETPEIELTLTEELITALNTPIDEKVLMKDYIISDVAKNKEFFNKVDGVFYEACPFYLLYTPDGIIEGGEGFVSKGKAASLVGNTFKEPVSITFFKENKIIEIKYSQSKKC